MIVLWYLTRIFALSAFTTLCLSLLTGISLRTKLLKGMAKTRGVLDLHEFLSVFWIPLIFGHIITLLLDPTSRVQVTDVVIPFQALYGTLAVGFGTIGFLMLLAVGISSYLRKHISKKVWHTIHYLNYPMLLVFVIHAQLAGSDFSRTWIQILGWGTIGILAIISLRRLKGKNFSLPSFANTATNGYPPPPPAPSDLTIAYPYNPYSNYEAISKPKSKKKGVNKNKLHKRQYAKR